MGAKEVAVGGDFAKRAAALRARRELDEIDSLRFIAEAIRDGLSQDALAEALGTSQATVSRMAKRIKEQPQVLRPTVSEVINRAVVKEITRPAMLRQLREMKIPYVSPIKRPDSDWARLREAHRKGLVTDSEARALVEETAKRMVARITHSMDLEAQAVPSESVQRMVREAIERIASDL